MLSKTKPFKYQNVLDHSITVYSGFQIFTVYFFLIKKHAQTNDDVTRLCEEMQDLPSTVSPFDLALILKMSRRLFL
jgi:hypothetical protein